MADDRMAQLDVVRKAGADRDANFLRKGFAPSPRRSWMSR
jgi:hypothetical protein